MVKPIDFDSNRSVIFNLINCGNYATIMIKFSMDQLCLLRNHGVKFGKNRIMVDSSLHITSSLEIQVYACKWLF